MSSDGNIVRGALKIDELPEGACFESFEALLKSLPKWLTVEVPRSVTNVIVGATQPNDDQRDFLWVRRGNDGGFKGIYVYALGEWRQVAPAPQQVYWMYGDSRDLPDGFILVDAANPNFTSAAVQFIQTQFVRDPTNTYWMYFATTFAGF